MSFIKALSVEAKAIILDDFIKNIEETNKKCGTVIGTIQIIDKLEEIAVEYGFSECPYCGNTHKRK